MPRNSKMQDGIIDFTVDYRWLIFVINGIKFDLALIFISDFLIVPCLTKFDFHNVNHVITIVSRELQ